jgi:hypothetical protein
MANILTGDIWKQVNKKIKRNIQVEAAIAYVSSANLKLKKNDILICNASKKAISNGETSAKILDHYFKKGVKIYSKQNVHTKILVTKNFSIIGSANLSNNSAKSLLEVSICTYDNSIISQINALIYSLKKNLTPLCEEDIKKLKQIPVVRRPSEFSGRRSDKIKSSGDKSWIMPTHDLSERILKEDESFTNRKTKEISKKTKLHEDNIPFIRCSAAEKISKQAKPGDQLMQLYKNPKGKQITVIGFCPIVDVVKKGKLTWCYYNSTDCEEISWTTFDRKLKKLNLERKIGKTSYRLVSHTDQMLLNTLFKQVKY